MEQTVYVVSDLHVGPGWLPDGRLDPLEDFTSDSQFAQFLDTIGTTGEPVELVIAGDFLEYCQTLPEIGLASPEDHLGSTEAESIRRTEVILGYRPDIASGHPEVFKALRRFMVEGNSITIIVGNHDVDLLWKGVWARIFDAIYPPGAAGDLRRVRYAYTLGQGLRGRVYIEHGHEYDPANRFGERMEHPFGIDRMGVRRLKRCWGTLFVDKVYNQLEKERWFIDNVKPILRVVKLGLRHDPIFTATAMGLVARFLLTSGLPPLLGSADERAQDIAPDARSIVAAIADPDLRAVLEERIDDPAFREEFERTVYSGDRAELALALSGVAPQLTLDDVTATTRDAVILGGGIGDPYRTAAQTILEHDPSVSTVIMGHTHGPLDGITNPIALTDGRVGYYFNSGTWTLHLKDEPHRNYTWAEIADPANYTASYTYVRLDPDGHGGYRPSLGRWSECADNAA